MNHPEKAIEEIAAYDAARKRVMKKKRNVTKKRMLEWLSYQAMGNELRVAIRKCIIAAPKWRVL